MQPYIMQHPEILKHLTEAELARLNAYGGWSFTLGAPQGESWTTQRQPGIAFALDACKNLDELCDEAPMPALSEGVVYGNIGSEKDGIMLLGFGCDWFMRVYCNGVLVEDTFDTGNGATLIMPSNHRVFMPVKKGDNLIAVHVKRGSATWNFTCLPGVPFELPPAPAIAYGPWVSYPDSHAVTIAFCSVGNLGCGIRYRRLGSTEWKLAWHQRLSQILRRSYHSIDLTDLEPGSDWEYQVVCIHPDTYQETPLGDLHTIHIPAENDHTFSVFITADLQFPREKQELYLENMLKAADGKTCDFYVFDGDVNSSFQPEGVISGPFEQMQQYDVASKPLIYIRGNHEMRGPCGDQFQDYFANRQGTTYSVFRYGDTAFMILDSGEDKPAETPGHAYCKWNMDQMFLQLQKDWFDNAVQTDAWKNAKRHIVICHGATYSHFDSWDSICGRLKAISDGEFAGKNPRTRINAWFAGHVHEFLRSIPGTREIAAESPARKPLYTGENYTYPVYTVGGPTSRSKIQASCFRLDFDQQGMLISSWDQDGNPLEVIRLDNNGHTTEIKAFKHYIPE